MNFSWITSALGKIGDYVGIATQWSIKQLASLGVSITPVIAKVLSLLIISGGIFFIAKMVSKPAKWIFIILLIILIIAVGVSFI